jgi:hypothetical protein
MVTTSGITADASLDLVEDQQCADRIRGVAGGPQVLIRQRMDAALSLDRLKQDGRGERPDRHAQGVDVVDRHVEEAFGQRGERRLVLRLAGGGQRPEGAPVERVGERDDGVRAALSAVPPRELDGRLVRLRPGVREEGAVERRAREERVGQLQLRDRVIQVRGGQQSAGLFGQRIGHGGVGMAEDVHRDAGDEVEVPVAGVVPHPAALAAHDDQRLARVDGQVDAGLELDRVRCAGLH